MSDAQKSRLSGLDALFEALLPRLSQAGLQPDARDWADALWLAAQIGTPAAPTPTVAPPDRAAPPPKPSPEAPAEPIETHPPQPEPDPPSRPRPAPATPQGERLYPPGGGVGGRAALGVRAALPPALPDSLELARAVRSLRRRAPSPSRRRLDEDATVDTLAHLWLAGHRCVFSVERPVIEPAYEVLLIQDDSATMVPWRPLLAEFRRLLDYSGAFRRVRVLRFDSGQPSPRLGEGRVSALPQRLANAPGRRLLLIASDGVGRSWHDGTVPVWLREWSRLQPVALLQMLPPRLWEGTVLGHGDPLRLQVRRVSDAGAIEWVNAERATGEDTELPTTPLRSEPSGRGQGMSVAAKAGLRDLTLDPALNPRERGSLRWELPILTAEPESLRAFGKLLAGRREAWCAGVRFGDVFAPATSPPDPAPEPGEAELERRWWCFHAEASPLARRLASLLAAVPLSPEVIRLVRQTALPAAGPLHLAELLLSGLLYRHPQLDGGAAHRFYDFRPGLRRRLLDGLMPGVAAQVLVDVSAYLRAHDCPCIDFAALLADPDGERAGAAGLRLDDANNRHFAEIGAAVLGRLGGRYALLAQQLMALANATPPLVPEAPPPPPTPPEPPLPTTPTPFRDRFLSPTAEGRNEEGPEMVWLPGGTFDMGSPALVGAGTERPSHAVKLSPYAVGKFPVTVGEFRRFVEVTGYRTEAEQGDGAYVWKGGKWKKQSDADWRHPYFEQDETHPVVCVSWNDARAYCEWLSASTGEDYRLLTEAEWEHACRTGGWGLWCFGDDEARLGEYAWFEANAKGRSHPVGEKRANAFGLHDLHGNVFEWCNDWYAEDFYQQLVSRHQGEADSREQSRRGSGKTSSEPRSATSNREHRAGSVIVFNAIQDPIGPLKGLTRVVRGGSWSVGASYCRSAFRGAREPNDCVNALGFRLARTGPLPSYALSLGGAAAPPAPEIPPFIEDLHDRLRDGSESPAMVWLRGGEFRMGQDEEGLSFEQPAHAVRLSAFSIGQFPVTFAEYDRFCAATVRELPDDSGWGRGRQPVINVSWEDAKAYCDWLSAETGEIYRLATEAEWEFACRAGSTTQYCFGDEETTLGDYAWYSANSKFHSHPVGERQPNHWQLYDMHGNVWEWCNDWFAADYYQQLATSPPVAARRHSRSTSDAATVAGNTPEWAYDNPLGPDTGSLRVVRGVSSEFDARHCRSACRGGFAPSIRNFSLGFRLARTGPWRSYPLTLVGAAAPPAVPAPSVSLPKPEPAHPRFRDYEVFRDRLAAFGDAEGPALVYIPGGEFMMGDALGHDDEKPVHPVRLSAYALGRTPVTVAEYLRFCAATQSHWPEWLEPGNRHHIVSGDGNARYYARSGIRVCQSEGAPIHPKGELRGRADPVTAVRIDASGNFEMVGAQGLILDSEVMNLPVVGISWFDALAYCEWLSEQTGHVYVLPTEAQWEFACRAGKQTPWCHGDDEAALGEYAWYSANAEARLHSVASKLGNAFGLFDMHGNVFEWCADWYASDCYRQRVTARSSDLSKAANVLKVSTMFAGGHEDDPRSLVTDVSENPTGPPDGIERVARGGSVRSNAAHCRSARRSYRLPSRHDHDLGFRLARQV